MSLSIIQDPRSKILFVVGPTASGKSALAMELARKFNGEIICADSQTLRRSLDIGTAKPSQQDQLLIKHHLLDIIEPYERFSVSQFKELAETAISDIRIRGKLPIVVGGTGLYINALFFDYHFCVDRSIYDVEMKQKLESMSVEELQEIIEREGYPMPENLYNPRHLIGVILREGQVHSNDKSIPGALIYGLMPKDEVLKQRIAERVDVMFNRGLVEEVKAVIEKYGNPPQKLDAICYPIIKKYLDGEINLDQTKEMFKKADWQYARKQKSWFKRNKNIQWFQDDKSAFEYIKDEIL